MPSNEHHRSQRSGWLRAVVLGANDGIVSTAALVLGVASATGEPAEVLVAGIAGLVAGAMSMAAGEYVSVSSQRDAELADVRLEQQAHKLHPEDELAELVQIYVERGLDHALATQVAAQFHARGAIEVHLREELGLDPDALARPILAALASAGSFIVGALVPVLVSAGWPGATWAVLVTTAACLAALGAIGAHLGGAPKVRATLRVVGGGLLAMAITAAIGSLVGLAL